MSNPENTKEAPLSEQQPDEKVKEASLSKGQSAEEAKEAPLPEGKPFEEVKEAPKAPKPTAIGNEKISILKHGIYIKSKECGEIEKEGVELTIKNVSDTTIGSALFEAVFYDKEGNIVDTVEHKIIDLQPNMKGSTILITSLSPERDKIESYNIRLVKTTMTPAPTATGNEKITIMKHDLSVIDFDDRGIQTASADLAIRNVSDTTIASAIFEALFYDIEGNTVDTVKHREIDFKPSTSRGISINCPITEYGKVKSYDVRLIKTTTTDVERVQLLRHEIRTTEDGEEEIRGIIKNISEAKTDAALIATFYDSKKENIGTKVIILRDIEANCIRQYDFKFKPQEGDIVTSFSLNIGEIAE